MFLPLTISGQVFSAHCLVLYQQFTWFWSSPEAAFVKGKFETSLQKTQPSLSHYSSEKAQSDAQGWNGALVTWSQTERTTK